MSRLRPLCIAASGLLATVGAGARDWLLWLHFAFKPLTTILILVEAWRAPAPVDLRYRRAVLIGIALSAIGDVFLMLPTTVTRSGFLLGLGSFLVAHLFFLRALTTGVRLFAIAWVPLLFGTIGAINLAILWPGLASGLRLPVLLYMLCLVAMTSQAVIRSLLLKTPSSRFAAMGGVFFLASDTVLAYNKFYAPIAMSALWILGTYYFALWLIARSVADSEMPEIKS